MARITEATAIADRRSTRTEQLRAEERAAREAKRRLDRMRRGREQLLERERRERLAEAIRETRARFPGCSCALRRGMTVDELAELGAGCTAPVYVCPRLDAVRRRVGL